MTGGQQFLDEMRADETRSARHQNSHRASVKMKLNTSKGRTSVGLVFALLVLFLIAFAVDVFFHIGHELLRPARSGVSTRLAS